MNKLLLQDTFGADDGTMTAFLVKLMSVDLNKRCPNVTTSLAGVRWFESQSYPVTTMAIDLVWDRVGIFGLTCCTRCNKLLRRKDGLWTDAHIIPSKHGGMNNSLNLVILCLNCKRDKGDGMPFTILEWEDYLTMPKKRVIIKLGMEVVKIAVWLASIYYLTKSVIA